MNNKNTPAFPTLIITALLVTICLAGCEQKPTQEPPEKPDFSNIESIAQLSAIRVYSHNVTQINHPGSWFFNHGYKKVWYEYDGIVELGVDANRVDISLPNEDNEVTVTLPPIQITYGPDVDDTSFSTPLTEYGFLTEEFTTDEQREAFSSSQAKMLEELQSDNELFDYAKERTKAIIERYVINAGKAIGQDYTVDWKEIE